MMSADSFRRHFGAGELTDTGAVLLKWGLEILRGFNSWSKPISEVLAAWFHAELGPCRDVLFKPAFEELLHV